MQITSSFRHRNFRLYFFGQGASLFGSWMQGTAVSWLVWDLTRSSWWLGVIGFASQIPILVFGLLAGVAVDRLHRRKLIIVIQAVAMVQAAILAFLTITGLINIYLLLALSLMMGTIMAFDFPSRQTFLMDMVGREDVVNAVALNSTLVHGARVMGPIVAGFIIAGLGEGTCFVINAVSFLFVLASLFMMNKGELYPQRIDYGHSILESIRSSIRFVRDTKEVRAPLMIMGVYSFAAMAYMILLPQIVAARFDGGAKELGFAAGAAGLGALIGAIGLATLKDHERISYLVRACLGISALGLLSLAYIPNLGAAMPVLAVIGLAGYLIVAGTNSILQLAAPHDSRGRLMSIFTVIFFGLTPIGSLLSGQIASIIGVGHTLAACGAVCLIAYLIAVKKNGRAKACHDRADNGAV